MVDAKIAHAKPRRMNTYEKIGEGGALRSGLILRNRDGLRGDPIRLRKLHPPESRRRGEKFDAHALALIGIVAEVHHPAFLLVFCERVGKDQ